MSKLTKEFYRIREDGVSLFRTFSPRGMKIRKVGTNEVYSEAIDVENAPYSYEETDDPIETPEVFEQPENPVTEG